MEDNKDSLDKKDLLDTLNSFYSNFNPHSHIMPPITRMSIEEEKEEKKIDEYKEHLKNIREFIDSFDNCSVSSEIIGEWNVIRKDINDYLFNYNISFGGSCPKLKEFYTCELEHLNSIKNKLGSNAIEYQMICSLVAESVILDVESSMILVKDLMQNRNDYTGRLINSQIYCNMLKDCLNALGNVASLNMEYQYKYERFSPFYKSLSEKGRQAGLAEIEKSNKKTGCLGVISILLMSAFLCSYFVFI